MNPDVKNAKLAVESMTVGYNGAALIRDITFSLKKGEILTLIGPNGSGKSTILKSITRHLALISGTVFIDGTGLKTLGGREVARRLAVVLTERARPELMTCRELVSAGRYPYTGSFGMLTPRDKEIVEQSLSRVHALDIADRDINEISDGQRQRILLARALCQEPEIIVLDEPTSFLDIRHKTELLEILSEMAKKRGITVVMSLHEIDLAERISDKIVCVKGETISACGTPDEIFKDGTVKELYEMKRGSFNALLGSIELSAPEGEPRCFVLGGGGKGIPFYRALRKRGVAFAAGVLLSCDVDCAVANALSDNVVSAPEFCLPGENELAAAKALVEKTEYVIDCGARGELAAMNEKLLEHAVSAGKRIIGSLKELSEADL